MLVGTDPVHTVVFEHKRSGWHRQVDQEELILVTSDEVARHLDSRLQGS